jgi:hypothetical protein
MEEWVGVVRARYRSRDRSCDPFGNVPRHICLLVGMDNPALGHPIRAIGGKLLLVLQVGIECTYSPTDLGSSRVPKRLRQASMPRTLA